MSGLEQSERPKVVVRLNAAGKGEISIDGKRLVGCRGIEIRAGLGQATNVTLDLIGVEVDLEAEDGQLLADVTDVSSEHKKYRVVEAA